MVVCSSHHPSSRISTMLYPESLLSLFRILYGSYHCTALYSGHRKRKNTSKTFYKEPYVKQLRQLAVVVLASIQSAVSLKSSNAVFGPLQIFQNYFKTGKWKATLPPSTLLVFGRISLLKLTRTLHRTSRKGTR